MSGTLVERDATTICVVEQPTDILPLERSGAYRGQYHVLGGKISPLDNIHPEDLRIDALDRDATFPSKAGGRHRPVLLPLVGNNVGYLQSDLVRRMPCLPAHDSRSPLIVTPRNESPRVL